MITVYLLICALFAFLIGLFIWTLELDRRYYALKKELSNIDDYSSENGIWIEDLKQRTGMLLNRVGELESLQKSEVKNVDVEMISL